MKKIFLCCLLFSLCLLQACDWQKDSAIIQNDQTQQMLKKFSPGSEADDKWTMAEKVSGTWDANSIIPTPFAGSIIGLKFMYHYLVFKVAEDDFSQPQHITFPNKNRDMVAKRSKFHDDTP